MGTSVYEQVLLTEIILNSMFDDCETIVQPAYKKTTPQKCWSLLTEVYTRRVKNSLLMTIMCLVLYGT